MGARAEKFKLFLTETHQPIKTLSLWVGLGVLVELAILLAIYLPPALKGAAHNAEASAKNAEDATGKVASAVGRLDSIAAKIDARIDGILDNAGGATAALRRTADATASQTPVILANLAGTARALQQPLSEATGLIADSRPLVQQNLEALRNNQQELGKSLPKLTEATVTTISGLQDVSKSPGYLATFGADGSLVHLNRTVQGFEPIGADFHSAMLWVNRSGVDVNRITDDSATFFHKTLFPAPCKDWGCRIKRGLGTAYRFTDFALRLEHEFRGLPVNIFRPVTIVEKQP